MAHLGQSRQMQVREHPQDEKAYLNIRIRQEYDSTKTSRYDNTSITSLQYVCILNFKIFTTRFSLIIFAPPLDLC